MQLVFEGRAGWWVEFNLGHEGLDQSAQVDYFAAATAVRRKTLRNKATDEADHDHQEQKEQKDG